MVDRDQTNPGTTPRSANSGSGWGTGAAASPGTASGMTSGTGGDVKQQAGEVASQVKDQALQLKDKAAEAATGALEDRKTEATSGLGNVSETIRQTGDQLRSNDQARIADYVDQAADRLDQFTAYLRGNDLRQIVGDVERFARREPTIFLGGAFVLGLLGARFLKSSGQALGSQGAGYQGQQDHGRQQNYGQGQQSYGTRAALSSYSSYSAMEHTQPMAVRPATAEGYGAGTGGSDYPTPTSGGMSSLGTGGSVQPSRPGGTMPASPASTAPPSTSSGTGAPDWQGGAARPISSVDTAGGAQGTGMGGGMGTRESMPGDTARIDRATDLTSDTRSKGDAGE